MPYFFSLLKHPLILCFFSFSIACNAPTPPEEPNIQRPRTAKELDVALNMTQPSYTLGMPVTLRFVLHNNQADSIRFCYLNSPAHEMVWSNYFSVLDEAGQPVPYIGKRPLYRGPVGPEYYMTLAPDEMKIYTVDLLPLYQMEKTGQYSVRFIGDKINLLPNSTPARFVLK